MFVLGKILLGDLLHVLVQFGSNMMKQHGLLVNLLLNHMSNLLVRFCRPFKFEMKIKNYFINF